MKHIGPLATLRPRHLHADELASIIAGHGNGLAGMSLKDHVDNPGQTPMKDHVDNPGQTPM
ncbi:MAG TPA: hypothetical protein VGD80_02875 [Kofleriaceae bacterium]